MVHETFNFKMDFDWFIWIAHHTMPLSKQKSIIERIIINTYTEMVCRCPFQGWILYLKGSPLTLEQKLCAVEICSLIKRVNCQNVFKCWHVCYKNNRKRLRSCKRRSGCWYVQQPTGLMILRGQGPDRWTFAILEFAASVAKNQPGVTRH